MARLHVTPAPRALFLAACSICPEIMQGATARKAGPHIEQNLWTELAACILGSRMRYETATSALERLLGAGLLDIDYLFRSGSRAVKAIAAALRSLPRADGGVASYPFPTLRAKQIRDSYDAIYREGGSLIDMLNRPETGPQVRRHLVAKAAGIGPKQASLFLRNVGHSDDLAVLDVHVLRYMHLMGLREPEDVPRTLTRYEIIERELRCHADQAGYSLGCFDFAVWVVMRAFSPPSRRPVCAS